MLLFFLFERVRTSARFHWPPDRTPSPSGKDAFNFTSVRIAVHCGALALINDYITVPVFGCRMLPRFRLWGNGKSLMVFVVGLGGEGFIVKTYFYKMVSIIRLTKNIVPYNLS